MNTVLPYNILYGTDAVLASVKKVTEPFRKLVDVVAD